MSSAALLAASLSCVKLDGWGLPQRTVRRAEREKRFMLCGMNSPAASPRLTMLHRDATRHSRRTKPAWGKRIKTERGPGVENYCCAQSRCFLRRAQAAQQRSFGRSNWSAMPGVFSRIAYLDHQNQTKPPDVLRTTAARMIALNAPASTSSPSWMSIARLVFPSRLEKKSLTGSFNAAPWAKVSFTLSL